MLKKKLNPVAKYSVKFNKNIIQKDRKKDFKRGYIKHKSPDFGRGYLI